MFLDITALQPQDTLTVWPMIITLKWLDYTRGNYEMDIDEKIELENAFLIVMKRIKANIENEQDRLIIDFYKRQLRGLNIIMMGDIE